MSGSELASLFLDNRDRLFENSKGFVIYDKFPVSKGHCLVIPYRVYSNYFDSFTGDQTVDQKSPLAVNQVIISY